jgi:predicted nucleic acid-binding protein
MIAAICSWHEFHREAASEIGGRLDRRERMIVAAPALVETYAVLTRFPPPHRLAAEHALALIEANFMKSTKIVALDARSYQNLLRQAPNERVLGGRTYDAVIAACALKARVSALLTFNSRDFESVARRLNVVVPSTN